MKAINSVALTVIPIAVFLCIILFGMFFEINDDDEESFENSPPYIEGVSDPQNGSVGVAINAILGWKGGDPDPGDTVSYDVYFGTTSPPPLVASNQSENTYNPGTMMYETTYYWKIVAWDNHGASAESPLWEFTTQHDDTSIPSNNPPFIPSNPYPRNGSNKVAIDVTLSWTGGDPDTDDILTYDVYFGKVTPPPRVATKLRETSVKQRSLDYSTTYYWKIVTWDNHGEMTAGPLWHFRTKPAEDPGSSENSPPYQPTYPSPPNGKINVSIEADLSWTGGDPDNDPVTYDVYFGSVTPPPQVSRNQSDNVYDPGTMNYETTYYWKVISWDDQGASTKGPVWNFTTIYAPHQPINPDPEDGAVHVNVNANLTWSIKDPGSAGNVTYDVHFGNVTPPPQVSRNQSDNVYDPGTMNYGTTYYWKIVAWDINGIPSEGPIWNFTTNFRPDKPTEPSPENGETNVSIKADLSWTGGDPDGDPVTYDVYFGSISPPPIVSNNQSNTTYEPGIMTSLTTYYWRIIAWDNQSASAESLIWSFTTIYLPHQPTAPGPENEAVDVDVSTNLTWTIIDPVLAGNVTYDVYFGTTIPPPKIISNQTYTTYNPGILTSLTTYYWKIVAWDNNGNPAEAPTWSFTTVYLPYQPTSPTPEDGATGVNVDADLSWTTVEPKASDNLTYDIYFGTVTPPPKIVGNYSQSAFDPGTMNYGTTYYWRVVAWNNSNVSTPAPMWSFTTNYRPNEPSDPYPEDHAVYVDINTNPSWKGGDPDAGDNVTYDVYFGVTTPPPKIISNQSETTFDPGTMYSSTIYHWKIVAWDDQGASAEGQIWSFTTVYLPLQPTDPNPKDGATGVSVDVDLSWSITNPEQAENVTFDVYFGTTTPPPKIFSNLSNTSCNPGSMVFSTTYYWKVIAWNKYNISTEGPIWSFTTNYPPYQPSDPDPENGAADISVYASITWTGGDPDTGDEVTYEVYFDTVNPPLRIVSVQSDTLFSPWLMNYNTTYYWKIVAWDTHGASTSGPVWSFTTEKDKVLEKIKIIKPEKALYIRNIEILPLSETLILGYIDIKVEAFDRSGIEKVEFYIDERLKYTDTASPYNWTWNKPAFGRHSIKVTAYDYIGNHASYQIIVRKFF